MNTPYKSIYEALPDHKSLRATKNKTKLIKTSTIPFDKLKQKQVIKKIETLIKNINSLINKFRNTFLKTNPKKLKIKTSDKFLSWKVSIFPKKLSSSYDEVASLEFSTGQEKIRSKILELFIELNNTLDTIKDEEGSEFLPEKYASFLTIAKANDWISIGSFSKSAYDVEGIISKIWKQIGITPATDYEGVTGLYRLHATNSPPACLKGQFTGKPGIGLLMYKGFIHYCGHGFTSSQSDEAKNVWISIKKDSNIISFEYENFRGLIAISTLLPKDDVIQILDRFLSQTGRYKTFYSWCKARMNEGDTLEQILDNELYALIENDIDKIKAGVLQTQNHALYDNDEDEDEGNYDDVEFDIESYNLVELFYDGFSDDHLRQYIKLFREDTYDSTLENLLDEGLEQAEAEEQAEEYMQNLKIVDYWEDATGENLYDTYLDNYKRINGEEVTTSRVLDDYGIDMDSFKKDGMYYDNVIIMFDYTINRLERSVMRNENFGTSTTTNQSSVGKSGSTTTNNYTSKGNTNIVDSENEAKQKVNISNLQWKDEEEDEDNPEEMLEMTINEAIRNTPTGYRLPTIQELYTQIKKESWGFNSDYYWSSSKGKNSNWSYWYINRNTLDVNISSLISTECSVRYVKDV